MALTHSPFDYFFPKEFFSEREKESFKDLVTRLTLAMFTTDILPLIFEEVQRRIEEKEQFTTLLDLLVVKCFCSFI